MNQPTGKDFLLSKGFEYAGHWHKQANKLTFSLVKSWAKRPVIYAFVDGNDQILYIGRTEVDLEKAMNRIKVGPEGQVTNHRLHAQLLKHLEKPLSIEIFSYTNAKDHSDLAAYFDEIKTELLQHTSPHWNLR